MIYLDSAATTLQKPPAVAAAVQRAIRTMASPGRGGHRAAMLAADTVFRCREMAAELFDVGSPERVVFTLNATHALNLAIHSLVPPGASVVVSGYEHNAVTRPLKALNAEIQIADSGLFETDQFLKNLNKILQVHRPSAVICTHVSNVFGYILPIDEVARICREKKIPLIVDASQSAGTLPVRLGEWGAAFIAMPGHKGLYGPQGTGMLLCGEGQAEPLLYGGTGSMSLMQDMPDFLPDRLEAGTHNVAGIAGLLEGLRYVKGRGEAQILNHEKRLIRQMTSGLANIPKVQAFYCEENEAQSGVLSFQIKGMDCEQAGELLGRRDIAVRAGLHCAPFAHRSAGTLESGTVRASVSAFNTEREIAQFLWTVEKLA